MLLRAVLLAFGLGIVLAVAAHAEPPTDANLAWIKQHAIPIKTVKAGQGFDDLQPLKALIGDARIVSLGEATHGSREIFQMKHRLLEFLATEMGFTLFSIEANLPEAYRLNDYVLRGEGDPDKLIGGMYFWTWNTHEVKDLVEWMRRFNQQESRRVEFTGFDMQTPDVAMQEVLRFLARADAARHTTAKAAYDQASKAQRVAATTNFGTATGSFPVDAARGKKVVYRGWIKTEKVGGYAGLWWRADGPAQKVVAFDNMSSQKINGTSDWQHYQLALDVPVETTNVNFGVLVSGSGTAWFDGLEVRLDDQPFSKPEEFDLDFEADALRGLIAFPQQPVKAELDAAVAKVGKQSLRLRFSEAPGGVSPAEFKTALTACEAVHQDLMRSREDLLKQHPAKDVDWALVNARVVATALQQRGGNMTVRDPAMAENVTWILEQHPQEKIVLWAHNFHVSKLPNAMGHSLDRKFGKQHLAIGFATSSGEYQAIGKQGLGKHMLAAPPAESYEAAFQHTRVPRFLLDLRSVSADSDDSGWMGKPHPFRSVGALASDQQFSPIRLPMLFDAVIYLEETKAAQPLR